MSDHVVTLMFHYANEIGPEGLSPTHPDAIFQERFAIAYDVDVLPTGHPNRSGRYLAGAVDGKFLEASCHPRQRSHC